MLAHKEEIQKLQLCVFQISEKGRVLKRLNREKEDPDLIDAEFLSKNSTQTEMTDAGSTKEDIVSESEKIELEIKKLYEEKTTILDKNPRLNGITPLFQDYEAEYYWFEVLQFLATLFIVAIAVTSSLARTS
jgi:hypothetical protein